MILKLRSTDDDWSTTPAGFEPNILPTLKSRRWMKSANSRRRKSSKSRSCTRRSCRARFNLKPSIASTALCASAAEQGNHKLQVLTFPSTFCTDRRQKHQQSPIPSGPARSTGFAKKAHDFFKKELQPLGYKLSAEIVTWPDGLPGDVAL